MNLRKSLADALKAALVVAFPMFASPRGLRRVRPLLLFVLHTILVAAVVGGLWWIQSSAKLDRYLELPAPQFRNLWLPLLFLLIYALSWAARWIWALLARHEESPVFPDIDKAWREALQTLDQAGIDVTSSPLFLIVGRPLSAEEALFQGIQPRLIVQQTPRTPGSPLHVYANREAIYLTCPGTSLLGRQAALLAESRQAIPMVEEGEGPSGEFLIGGFATLAPTAQKASEAVEQILERVRLQGRDLSDLHEEERHALGILSTAPSQEEENVRWILQDRVEADSFTQRLQHLCRLVARDRQPFCPINGILLILPLATGRNDQAAAQIGQLAQRDLSVIRNTLRVNCPVFALVSDLESSTGFAELATRLTEDQRGRRMGQRFPLVPDVEPVGRALMITRGVQQIGNRLIPNLVSNLWRVESPGETSYADALQANIELYQLLGGVRDSQARIAKALSRAVLPEGAPPAMLGGCYFGATGGDSARDQAFIPGVMHRLIESQDFVAWTPAAIEEDQRLRRWARAGYVMIALGFLLSLAGVAYLFYRG